VTHKVAVWMAFAYVLKFHLPIIIPLVIHTHLPCTQGIQQVYQQAQCQTFNLDLHLWSTAGHIQL